MRKFEIKLRKLEKILLDFNQIMMNIYFPNRNFEKLSFIHI